jgi:hypothetical protein
VETTSGSKRCRINELASEVAHHQQVRKTGQFSFDSRRLHQTSLAFGELRLGKPAQNALAKLHLSNFARL